MSLDVHVKTLARGPGRSRSLTKTEAADAMTQMLGGAAPEAIGALLMLLRMKGEVPAEIAGLTGAAQSRVSPAISAGLDWPCYAAGRTRGQPWFVLAARLVADAGFRVLLHGADARPLQAGPLQAGLDAAGIRVAGSASDIEAELARTNIVYAPLAVLCPQLAALLHLRGVLGLRSCVNTVCRMLDPGRAGCSVQGVFHPSYRALQAEASALLGRQTLTVIKGGGGEFERHPGKVIAAHGLRGGALWQADVPPLLVDTRRLAEVSAPLGDVWRGAVDDQFAQAAVLGTAALALETLGVAEPEARAQALWDARTRQSQAA